MKNLFPKHWRQFIALNIDIFSGKKHKKLQKNVPVLGGKKFSYFPFCAKQQKNFSNLSSRIKQGKGNLFSQTQLVSKRQSCSVQSCQEHCSLRLKNFRKTVPKWFSTKKKRRKRTCESELWKCKEKSSKQNFSQICLCVISLVYNNNSE